MRSQCQSQSRGGGAGGQNEVGKSGWRDGRIEEDIQYGNKSEDLVGGRSRGDEGSDSHVAGAHTSHGESVGTSLVKQLLGAMRKLPRHRGLLFRVMRAVPDHIRKAYEKGRLGRQKLGR